MVSPHRQAAIKRQPAAPRTFGVSTAKPPQSAWSLAKSWSARTANAISSRIGRWASQETDQGSGRGFLRDLSRSNPGLIAGDVDQHERTRQAQLLAHPEQTDTAAHGSE